MENLLCTNEVKDQTVIIIIYTDKKPEPFYVVEKKPGRRIVGTTIYWGEKLNTLIERPHLYCKIQHHDMNRLFAIGEPNRINVHVIGYRFLTEFEKEEWTEKIILVEKLNDLIEIIKNS